MTRFGSRKASCASPNDTPCLRWFSASLAGSHSKLDVMPECYHSYGIVAIRLYGYGGALGLALQSRLERGTASGTGRALACTCAVAVVTEIDPCPWPRAIRDSRDSNRIHADRIRHRSNSAWLND